MTAVNAKLPDLVEALLSVTVAEKGLDVNARPVLASIRWSSVLHQMVGQGDAVGVAKLMEFKGLLKNKLLLEWRDNNDMNAADLALELGQQKILEILLKYGLGPSNNNVKTLTKQR